LSGSGRDSDHLKRCWDARRARSDAPEITASVTALAVHHSPIGPGVVIGSNVLNLAAVVAGEITLHPRVVVLEGAVAITIATICLGVVLGGPGPGWACSPPSRCWSRT
jgi:hypothetical protein